MVHHSLHLQDNLYNDGMIPSHWEESSQRIKAIHQDKPKTTANNFHLETRDYDETLDSTSIDNHQNLD